MKTNIVLRIFMIFMTAVICMAVPMDASAQKQQAKGEGEFKAMFNEAYNQFRNKRGLEIADSLYHLAMEAGNTHIAVRSLLIPVKYECIKDHNEEAMLRVTERFMSEAKKYGYMDFFYSGVSFRVTYYINEGMYDKAVAYQQEMLDFAKSRGDSYGLVIGHTSMGNFYRKRMHMARAICQYTLALDAYRKYRIKNDLGFDYKRIVECYLIEGDFNKLIEAADKGLEGTTSEQIISGLYGYKAFAYFMLGKNGDFYDFYAKYSSYNPNVPSIEPFVANCIATMKLIYDGKDDEVERLFAEPGLGKMGAFKTYVEIAYYQRKGLFAKQLEAMRRVNVSLYGDSRGTFAAEWARTSAMVDNNLAEIDRQRAANINSRLELVNAALELKSTQLGISRARDAERLALMSADAKRLSLNNQRLLSRQLRDSLATQQVRHLAQMQEIKSDRVKYATILVGIIIMIFVAYYCLRYNAKMASQLMRTNNNLKKTLADLSVASEQAQESDRKKTQFIQNMSHEIRTPLNSIVGFSQVLAEQEEYLGAEERNNMTHIINSNSEVLNTLINDILDLTSLESGKYVMKQQQVTVNELCFHAIAATRSRKVKGVHLVVKTDLPDEFVIVSDEFRLQQVLTNMLTNAMKNTEKGSIVLNCSLTERSGMLTFTVTDTGIGVPKDKQKEIFERFCKLDQFKQGVGLGLDMCRIIAAKLGGEIDIDPDYTDGARFWFAIPV